MRISRRHILKAGGQAALLSTGAGGQAALAQTAAEPHYFLEILIEGGWDVSYLFDARPLLMTKEAKIQNYSGVEPDVWTDSRGLSCLAGPIVQPLKKHFESFSILNGVHMAAGFDGHDQNSLYALTGNPFGGETNLAHLGLQQSPLDYLQIGQFFSSRSIKNRSRAITLNSNSALQLSQSLQKPAVRSLGNRLDSYIYGRLEANGASQAATGLFADGNFKLREALKGSDDMERRLQKVSLDFQDKTPMHKNLQVITQYFKQGLTKVGTIFLAPAIDAHDGQTAKALPTTLAAIVAQLDEVFSFLKGTAATSSRNQSLLDETTVLITSEFSRTMRQKNAPIDKTGTDHNPLSNSILIGGKGIRAGLIIGASDNRQSEEILSPAHRKMDPDGLSFMGLPFDYEKLTSLQDFKPENFAEYKAQHYLNFAAVANSLYQLFKADPALHWKNDRNSPAVPALQGLLKS